MKNALVCCTISLLGYFSCVAQGDMQDTITEVTIEALRIESNFLRVPMHVSQIDVKSIRDLSQQLSLQEYISQVPGVFSLNATNYAQDLRISIRGFGARAAFGIRGIKLVVDGIPETTPDGQGQLDNLTLNTIDKIEIIKGPASSLYGNASGGVIHIQTTEDFQKPFVDGGITFGSFGMQQYQFSSGLKTKQTRLLFSGNHVKTNGYRDQSGMKSSSVGAKLIHDFANTSELKFAINYTNSPQADDPGGINAELAAANPRQARDRNVLFQTGEAISQLKLSTHYETPISDNMHFESYGFYSTRNFEGLLPFEFGGWVDLDRTYWGAGASLTQKIIKSNAVFTGKLGIDLASQADDRLRYRNLEGTRGDPTLDQLESFDNFAAYYLGHTSLSKWDFTVGLRWDNNTLSAEDRFLANGDDSGEIKLNGLTSSLGLNYALRENMSLFINVRESFETPSLSELSTNPSGTVGFNEDIKAQEAVNVELGVKSMFGKNKHLELTVFHISTENDLVPFELEEFPDRAFFRNAGSTSRTGIELFLQYPITNNLTFTGNYAFSDFTYSDYLVNDNQLDGNRLPAIPQDVGSLALLYSKNNLDIKVHSEFIGQLFANDANSVELASYNLTKLSVSYAINKNGKTFKPFFGINNLFDTAYNDNIRINAFGSRFFEPGPGVNVYGGLRVRL